ncbi:MAG: class I SAM-dependent methyltransferase [Gammaproteobacteria bacterium]
MKQDIARWNDRYRLANPNPDFQPNPLLRHYRTLLEGKGKVLDVACGVGHNALFLAELGNEVVAVDGSLVGLAYCQERLRDRALSVALVAADLERFFPPANYFDMVLVVRYHDRRLFSRWSAALRSGGLFIYHTFNRNLLQTRPHFPRHYLLERGELSRRLRRFCVLATNDGPGMQDTESYWIGYKS